MPIPRTTQGAMQERMPSARPEVIVRAGPSLEEDARIFVGL